MNSTLCAICNNAAYTRLHKGNVEYFQCSSCRTLFSGPLDNDNMVGGGNEEARNKEQNEMRINRIAHMLGGYKPESKVLDFGCGHGMLVEDLLRSNFKAEGYDLYNEQFNDHLPKRDSFHLVTMIEVIEHTSRPYYELDVIHRALVKGGAVMIETSFVDIADEEKIPLEEFFYIAPEVGHSTIFSHHGLDLLMVIKGFLPMQHANRNCRIYQKA